MSALILGASAGLGRALGRELAAKGHDLVLVARDARDLDAEAAHLHLTHGVRVQPIAADASRPAALIAVLQAALGVDYEADIVLCPIGFSRSDDDCGLALPDVEAVLATNLVAVMALLTWLLPAMQAKASGSVVGFSSVAVLRGRGSNVTYAAAKRGLESYFESLRHHLADTPIRVQLYRLGYLDTQQSFGKKLLFPKADPAIIARRVAGQLHRDTGRVTLPAYWWLISLAVRLLPWAAFRRLRF